MEVSVALNLKRRDIDEERREVRAKGTKTKSRDRVAMIAQWAWPYVERHIANLLPEAPLFPNMDRWRAADAHKEACKAIGRSNYQQRDARHTYAVIAIRAGAANEVVAGQLGHANTSQVTNVYGRYRPTDNEKRNWEERAEEMARFSIA
jgi:integrase